MVNSARRSEDSVGAPPCVIDSSCCCIMMIMMIRSIVLLMLLFDGDWSERYHSAVYTVDSLLLLVTARVCAVCPAVAVVTVSALLSRRARERPSEDEGRRMLSMRSSAED